MKCQEVMMYMQRQLDGDLTPHEEDELHAHLMHCLDCAQMFERLQALSDELSQLPKVMPPFSLVDAIMPQLLDLDKQTGNSATPEKVIVINSTSAQPQTKESTEQPRLSRIRNQFSWKIAGGVVAAGLILGFFAFNLGNPVIDQADGFRLFSSSSETKSEKNSSAAATASQLDKSGYVTGTLDNNQKENTSNEASTGTSVTDQFGQNLPKSKSPEGSSGNKLDDDAGGSGVAGPKASAAAKLEPPAAFSSPVGGNDALDMQASPTTTAPAKMVAPNKTNANTESKDANSPAPAAGLVAPSTPKEANSESSSQNSAQLDKTAPSGENNPYAKLGIQSFQVPQVGEPLMSTSGLYMAVIEDAHVVIRNSSTLEVVFVSPHLWLADDEIKLVEWSKDSKFFYQVKSKGSIQTIMIDVAEKSEVSK